MSLPDLANLSVKTDVSWFDYERVLNQARKLYSKLTARSSGKRGDWSKELPQPGGKTYDEYTDLLYGNKASPSSTVRQIAQCVESGEVLSSVSSSPFLTTLPNNLRCGTRQWWQSWSLSVTPKVIIGEGSFNKAYLVIPPENDYDRRGAPLPNAEFFDKVYGLPLPKRKGSLIIRESKKLTKQEEVVKEIITAGYAQANGIGPFIYATWYYQKAQDVTADMKAATEATLFGPPTDVVEERKINFGPFAGTFVVEGKKKVKVGAMVEVAVTVAEAWDGDCTDPRDLGNADTFARELYKLCMRAASVGFWHMDIKGPNMLYRKLDGGRRIELAFTDFDPYFCKVFGEERNDPKWRKCCVVATMSMVLATWRCTATRWSEELAMQNYVMAFSSACRRELARNDIDVTDIEPSDWCSFLRVGYDETLRVLDSETNKRTKVELPPLSKVEQELSDLFANHISNYFLYDPEKNTECYKIDKTLPSWPQIVKYGLGMPDPRGRATI